MNNWIYAAGLLMGILLGYLDYFLLLSVTRKALSFEPRRAIRLARWGGFGRLVMVFLGLLLGVSLLGPSAFLVMAIAFGITRAVGLVWATRRMKASPKPLRGSMDGESSC